MNRGHPGKYFYGRILIEVNQMANKRVVYLPCQEKTPAIPSRKGETPMTPLSKLWRTCIYETVPLSTCSCNHQECAVNCQNHLFTMKPAMKLIGEVETISISWYQATIRKRFRIFHIFKRRFRWYATDTPPYIAQTTELKKTYKKTRNLGGETSFLLTFTVEPQLQ